MRGEAAPSGQILDKLLFFIFVNISTAKPGRKKWSILKLSETERNIFEIHEQSL